MNTLTQTEPQQTQAHAKRYLTPPVNIFESANGYVLEAEIPGVAKDGLEITLDGNELTIIGHRQDEAVNAQLVYRETRQADYRRTFELDPAIDTTKISAKVEQGVLTLQLPKQEKVKPRKINIAD